MTVNKVAEVSAQYLAELEENAVPVGYKQTEVGLIPEDWEESTINDVLSEISMGPFGSDIKVSNFVDCGVPVLSGLNVNAEKLKDQFTNYVTKEKAKALKKAVASRGDVVVTHRGTIGQISYIPEDSLFEKYVISQSQFRARFVSKVLPSWVVLYFHSSQGSRSLLEGKSHTGVPAIAQATTTFRKLKLSLPRIEEQTAIANALSDVDALISELEKLIAKKQAIKTATMQQLLTGRTRLPQFALREDGSKKGYKQSELGEIPEDWNEHGLGVYVAALDAGVSVNSVDESDAFPHGKHILKTSCVDRGNFIPVESKSILPSDLKRARCTPVEGSIIVSRMNTPALVGEIGYVAHDYPELYLPDRLWQMRFKGESTVNTRWLSCVLSFPSVAKRIKDSATGTSGSMKNISKESLMGLELAFPVFEEQTSIATILSDMDSEIQTIQQRLTKTRQIKQGMMQELLTGKNRLNKPKEGEYAE